MKKKNVSRVIALALASMMCFSACGQSGKEVTSKESEQPVSDSTVQESSSETEAEDLPYWELLDQVSDTSELPDWTGEILEVNIWSAGGTNSKLGEIPETNVTYKELERVTGVRINAEESYDNGGVSVDAKLPMVIASKDLPTIILGYNIDQTMQELYNNGYLADLTEYYENGTLDQLDKALSFDKAQNIIYKNYQADDGSYYLIPYTPSNMNTMASLYDMVEHYPEQYDRDFYLTYGKTPTATGGKTCFDTILVRDDILKAVRPDALSRNEIEEIYLENGTFTEEEIYSVNINSMEELVDFLNDVQDEVASGGYTDLNGRGVEVTYGPHTETDNWGWMYTLSGLVRGLAYSTNYFAAMDYTATDSSKLLVKSYMHEESVEYMKMLNGLVRDGIIAKDSLLDNKAVFDEKCLSGHYAVAYQNTPLLELPEDTAEWRYSPIWLNIPANESMGGVTQFSINVYFGVFKDALTEEQLDQLMHAINYLNSEVGINNFYWGPQSAGLFDVDAEGNRYYSDPEVKACMVDAEDNGANLKYGLSGASVAQQPFLDIPLGLLRDCLKPSYLASGQGELQVKDATKYFNPGILPGRSDADSAMYFPVNVNVYNGVAQTVEGLKQFWGARAGFENQMKKVIVAESDAEFDKQLAELDAYATENGFDDKALSEFNDKFIEANEDALRLYGFIK